MNDLMNLTTTTMTMSSLEIAKLVESNHADVRRTVERLTERDVITLPPLAEVSNPGMGPKTIKIYNLEKRDSFVVVAQLSPEFTARLVDRWQELEQQQAPMTQTEILVAQAQRLLDFEREQRVLSEKTAEISSRLDQIETAGTHFTIMGWSSLNGRQVTLPMASSMGKKATKHCKTHGIQTGSVPDPRFGRANTYPKDVLDYLFAD